LFVLSLQVDDAAQRGKEEEVDDDSSEDLALVAVVRIQV
jgi:hypothetical protein